ncbi:hypothetical protein BU25DRAFT_382166 [Macroventuria anomochaeta]|uniref:Uncharacterized protein n=1 Tax=Macroventuria anomochaeta TaxID=301207 RepID=A0ACB6SF54_9PLEO|nr:uncharacterized protein BU25DRAFT_382166 [Macroventuria anomochaeta]KAF2632593.1 hypothetical protein BU25DRAFT_382166 [Macroventuria anomochaeta]
MTSPANPIPAPSAPAQIHTPYPDAPNSVDEPHTSRPSPAAPQQHMYEAPSRSRYSSASSQYQNPHLTPTTETFHLPPSHVDYDPESNLSAYDDMFFASSGFEQVVSRDGSSPTSMSTVCC